MKDKLNTTVVAGIAVLFLGTAAYLTLVLTGHESATDKLLTFLGPSVAALVIVGHQQKQQAETKDALAATEAKVDLTNEELKEQLKTVISQTNGVMDGRIEAGATKALAAYDISGDVKTALADMLADRLPEPIPVTVVDEPATRV